MNALYQHRLNKAFYLLADGEHGDLFTKDGYSRFILEPADGVRNDETGKLVKHSPGVARLVATPMELEANFKPAEGFSAVFNSPIEKLFSAFPVEEFDFTDKAALISSALGYAESMQDCHLRCVLHKLATLAEAELTATTG